MNLRASENLQHDKISRAELKRYILSKRNISKYWSQPNKLKFFIQKGEAPKCRYIPKVLESLTQLEPTSHWALIVQGEEFERDGFEFSIEIKPDLDCDKTSIVHRCPDSLRSSRLESGGVLEYAGDAFITIEGLLEISDYVFDAKNFKSYQLIYRNCQNFVLELLQELGVKVERFQVTAKRVSIGVGVAAAAAGAYYWLTGSPDKEDDEDEKKN